LIARLAIVLGVLLASIPARADTWTVMVYVAADNDIEADSVDAATDMVSVSGDNLTVVVQADRFGAHDDTAFPGTEAYRGSRRFLIQDGAFAMQENLGALDATDPQTLADFIAWAVDAYPADHWALVLWDHGGAWQGTLSDEHHGRQLMPAIDVMHALDAGLPIGTALDLLGFDSCLMANVDVVQGVVARARVLVASEEEQMGNWDYGAFFHAIVDTPDIAPIDLAHAIVDAEPARAADDGDPTFTLAAIDGDRVTDQLLPALGAFGSTLTSSMGDPRLATAITHARAQADGFGRSPPEDIFEVIDLGQFAHTIATDRTIAGTPLAAQASATLDAIDATVVHHVAGPVHRGAFGLSIYLPAADADDDYGPAAVPFADDATWPAFVSAYAAHSTGDANAPAITDAAFVSSSPVMLAHIDGSDVDRVSIALARETSGGLAFLGALPSVQGGGAKDAFDGGPVRFAWGGEWPRAIDATSDAPAPIVPIEMFDDAGDHALVAMPVELDRGDGYAPAVVLFDLDLGSMRGRAIGAYRVGEGGASTARLAGTHVRIASVVLRPDGGLTIAPGDTVLSSDTLAIAPRAISGDGYQLGIVVSDLAGHVASRFAPIVPIATPPAPAHDDATLLTLLAAASAALLLLAILGVWFVRRRRANGG
jgi:hypothetical protein